MQQVGWANVFHTADHDYSGSEVSLVGSSPSIRKEMDSDYMAFWTRQNWGDNEEISGCQEFWG